MLATRAQCKHCIPLVGVNASLNVPLLHHDYLRRDDLELPHDLFADLLHGFPADGTFQLFLRNTVLNDFRCYAFREIIQGILMLLVALMSRDKGFLLVLGSLMICDDFRFVEQEAQLLAAVVPQSSRWTRRTACAVPAAALPSAR